MWPTQYTIFCGKKRSSKAIKHSIKSNWYFDCGGRASWILNAFLHSCTLSVPANGLFGLVSLLVIFLPFFRIQRIQLSRPTATFVKSESKKIRTDSRTHTHTQLREAVKIPINIYSNPFVMSIVESKRTAKSKYNKMNKPNAEIHKHTCMGLCVCMKKNSIWFWSDVRSARKFFFPSLFLFFQLFWHCVWISYGLLFYSIKCVWCAAWTWAL